VDSKPAGPPERKMLDRVIEKLSKKDPHRIFQRPVTDEEVLHWVRVFSVHIWAICLHQKSVWKVQLRLAVATAHTSVAMSWVLQPRLETRPAGSTAAGLVLPL
jgi:hypothetical protein